MDFVGKVKDANGVPNFKEIANLLSYFQETFAPVIGHKDAELNVKPSNVTDAVSNVSQTQRIPDVTSRDEFPALGVSIKKTSPRTHSRPRRINPTPVGKVTTATPRGANPVFDTLSLSAGSTTSLQEERRLLVEERNRLGMKFGKKINKSAEIKLDKSDAGTSTQSVVCEKARIDNGDNIPLLSAVTNKTQLDSIALCYSSLLKEMLIPNITTEMYFILQLLMINTTRAPHLSLKGPFSTISNCVYFAVTVISHVDLLFAGLDGRTLHLLSQSSRVKEFSPSLSKHFQQCYQEKGSQPEEGVSPNYHVFGVPFQVEYDNRKNFASDKAFHSFKKQRDMFYELLKEWEKGHDKHQGLGHREKIRSLMECGSSSLPHFAKLFQRQLVESSRRSSSDDVIGDTENELVNNLKKSNPSKFLRLHERFSKMSSSDGPCPPPCFTQHEQFYTEFLLATDSYTFNQLLKQQLFSEITKLNARRDFETTKELADVIMTLRVLARYLGFLVFLPYQNVPATISSADNRFQVEPYDILKCVKDCSSDGDKLCVTIPWVVEFCVMMDTHALTVPYYHQLITSLIAIYRSMSSVVREGRSGHMLVMTSLGWLFELHTVSNGVFYEQAELDHITILDHSTAVMKLIDDTLLLRCCPYLRELHGVLSESGRAMSSQRANVRKIKPVSVITEDPSVQKERRVQAQLQENFFRNQPPYLKKLCEMVSERVSSNVITYSEQEIVPSCVLIGLKDLVCVIKSNIVSDTVEDSLDIPIATVTHAVQKCSGLVVQQSQDHCESYCRLTSQSSLQPLLVATPSEQILDAVTSITVSMAKEQHWKWVCQEARGLVSNELERQLVGIKKTITSAMRKSGDKLLRSDEYLTDDDIRCYQFGAMTTTTLESLPGYDALRDKIKQAKMNTCSSTLVDELTQLVTSITTHLAKQLFILPDVLLPQLLPRCCVQLASMTFQLSVQLVSHDNLTWNDVTCFRDTGEQTTRPSLLTALVRLWKLLKGAKVPLPCDELLSHEAFHSYFTNLTGYSSTWTSLSQLLVMLLHHNLCTSPVIEALWMCRVHEFSDGSVDKKHCLQAASIFLDLFYTADDNVTSVAGRMRDVHFVRLLSAILESGITDVPVALKSHAHFSKLIHPI